MALKGDLKGRTKTTLKWEIQDDVAKSNYLEHSKKGVQ